MIALIRIMVGFVALLGIGALSRAPFDVRDSEHALLRLSWRVRGEPVQHCRERTPEELAALPAHMRTPQVCTGRVARYRLTVRIDDQVLPVRELRGAGAHSDRPIYVFEEVPVSPGAHNVMVEFFNVLDPSANRLRLRQQLRAEEGAVLLITYDEQRGLFLASDVEN